MKKHQRGQICFSLVYWEVRNAFGQVGRFRTTINDGMFKSKEIAKLGGYCRKNYKEGAWMTS